MPTKEFLTVPQSSIQEKFERMLYGMGHHRETSSLTVAEVYQMFRVFFEHYENAQKAHLKALDEHMKYCASPVLMNVFGNTKQHDIERTLTAGAVVNVAERSGKTAALLAYADACTGRLGMEVGFISPHGNVTKQEMMRARINNPRPGQFQRVLNCPIGALEELRGRVHHVVVDDWWACSPLERKEIRERFEIIGAVGTLPELTRVSVHEEEIAEDQTPGLRRR